MTGEKETEIKKETDTKRKRQKDRQRTVKDSSLTLQLNDCRLYEDKKRKSKTGREREEENWKHTEVGMKGGQDERGKGKRRRSTLIQLIGSLETEK